jgi:PAS domain S-box-containing protein
MKTSSKLFLIQFIIIAGLVLFVLAWGIYNSRQTRLFLMASQQHSEKIVDQVLYSAQENITRPLNDNSEWKETSNYLEHPTRTFELECINTLLETFGFNAIFVYDRMGKQKYSINDSSDRSLSSLLNEIEVHQILSVRNPKCHFFITRDNKLFEIFGATIVSTNDRKHITASKGFLFFALYWDKGMLQRTGLFTHSMLSLDFKPQNSSLEVTTDENKVIRLLTDWSGKPIANIVFTKTDPFVKEWMSSSRILGIMTIFLGILIILVINYAFRRWISKPLISSIDELKYSENRFRQVAENAGEWIWEIDSTGMYLYSNPIVEKILGYKADELIQKKYFYDLFPINIRESMKAEIFESIQKRHTFRDFINKNVHKNGRIVLLQSSCSPFYDKSGNFMGYRGTDLDITDQKQAFEDLRMALAKAEENDRLKTAFLNNISHEIRTPMNAIIGYSTLLNEADAQPHKRKAFTEIICNAGTQLLSIIDDIINISTLEAGQEILRLGTTDLNALMKSICQQFQLRADSKNIQLEVVTHLSGDLARIHSDETKLNQILSNLLINALKFTKHGRIVFGYTIRNNQLEFFVEDSGIGIPQHMHGLIFERFRQVDSSVIREYGGTGLGLAISKAYVELLGGKIWLKSEPGKGSTFYFTIPYLNEQGSREENSIQLKPTIFELDLRKTILVAEDEEYNFLLIKEILSNFNCEILRASNGEEAVEICRNNDQISFVLMDIKMPLMDGFEATRRIKSFKPHLPVIAQSAYVHDEDKNKASLAGCDDYITKPFEKGTFVKLMETYGKENTSPVSQIQAG